MTTETITVAIYARCSSEEQRTTSIPDQLNALRAEAKRRGYPVTKEYIDEGKSGSLEIEKRIAFHQMIADSYKREFSRILVWDSSRFGRLDSQKGAAYKVTLRQNGVGGIECLNGGMIDWSTQMGRLQDALMSEADHEYALKLSAAVVRGRVATLLERGMNPHGAIAYGYDRLYTDSAGNTHRISRDTPFQQPRGWRRELVVNEEDAAVVRDIFDRFVNRSQSSRQIGLALSTPEYRWSRVTITNILRNKSYIGYATISGKNRGNEVHTRMQHVEVPGIIPAIIDEQVWYDAQRLLAGTAKSKWRSDQQRTLTGILRCGKCGYTLVSKTTQKEKNTRVRYVCGSTLRHSTDCPQWRVYQDQIMPAIISELVKVVDQEVLASLITKPNEAVSPAVSVQQEVVALREKVRRAVTRAATADDELVEEYETVAKGLRKELTEAEGRLKLQQMVEREGGPALWASWWADVRPGLVLATDDPELSSELSEALRRHPAFASLAGRGGFDEFKEAARKGLVRVAADGNPDPVLAILQQLLDGESEGVVLDSGSLRGVLRRLGCEVTVYWVPNPDNPGRRVRRIPGWIVDKARLSISFGGCGGTSGQVRWQSSKNPPSAHTMTLTVRRWSRNRHE